MFSEFSLDGSTKRHREWNLMTHPFSIMLYFDHLKYNSYAFKAFCIAFFVRRVSFGMVEYKALSANNELSLQDKMSFFHHLK